MGMVGTGYVVKGSALLLPSNGIHVYSRPLLSPSCSFSAPLPLSCALSRGRSSIPRFLCTAPKAPAATAEEVHSSHPLREMANSLEIRVGRILRAWKHGEADSLYVEEVDVGEPEPRIICSGLVNYVHPHELQDRQVVVLVNLKPRNMRGVKSCGMLMAASDASHEMVELLVPPKGSLTGSRLWFGSMSNEENHLVAATPNQVHKKKIWELVQPHLKTNDSCSLLLVVIS